MIDLSSTLKLLTAVGPVVARLPEFAAIYKELVATFSTSDQARLNKAYADLVAENDQGHARLQDKLRPPSKP
jgi:hypothetical protein